MALIAAMRNALPALLASLASKDAEIERQALALREMTFSRDTWRKVAEGRGSDIERETKIARAAESRLTTALAALGEARKALRVCERQLRYVGNGTEDPAIHDTAETARATLAKLNALEGNEDGTR